MDTAENLSFAGKEVTPTAARHRRGYGCRRFGHGYYTFEVDGYRTFLDDIAPLFLDVTTQFVWRGARNPAWPLQSTLSRHIESLKVGTEEEWIWKATALTKSHIIQFMDNLRGLHLLKPQHDDLYHALVGLYDHRHKSFLAVLKELGKEREQVLNEVFSIGQHHDLYTPFLDWTDIPAIALFFAFAEADDVAQPEGVGNRVVYAFNRTWVTTIYPPSEAYGDDSILFLGSMAHDNPRIIGQRGSFTYIPAHQPVDEWVVKHVKAWVEEPVLIRFLIRNEDRVPCLKHLSSLNIHERAIFPDRHGAANRSNYLLLREVAP